VVCLQHLSIRLAAIAQIQLEEEEDRGYDDPSGAQEAR
jgi:hypothetical protein